MLIDAGYFHETAVGTVQGTDCQTCVGRCCLLEITSMRSEITVSVPLVCHAQAVTWSWPVVPFSVPKLFVFQTKHVMYRTYKLRVFGFY